MEEETSNGTHLDQQTESHNRTDPTSPIGAASSRGGTEEADFVDCISNAQDDKTDPIADESEPPRGSTDPKPTPDPSQEAGQERHLRQDQPHKSKAAVESQEPKRPKEATEPAEPTFTDPLTEATKSTHTFSSEQTNTASAAMAPNVESHLALPAEDGNAKVTQTDDKHEGGEVRSRRGRVKSIGNSAVASSWQDRDENSGPPSSRNGGKIESVRVETKGETDLDNSSLTADEAKELNHDDGSDSSLLVSPSPAPVDFVSRSLASTEQTTQGPYMPGLPQHTYGYPVQIVQAGIPTGISTGIPQSILTAPQVMHHPTHAQIMAPAPPQHPHAHGHGHPPQQSQNATSVGGRRKIRLRLQEEISSVPRQGSFFSRSSRFLRKSQLQSVQEHVVDRGEVSVSWFEGTTSSELQEHVRRSVIRETGLQRNTDLSDMRIIDESIDPPEEIVLSPFIPDGSQFLLKFNMDKSGGPEGDDEMRKSGTQADRSGAGTDAASISTSPGPMSASSAELNARLLAGRLKELQPGILKRRGSGAATTDGDSRSEDGGWSERRESVTRQGRDADSTEVASQGSNLNDGHVMGYNPEDQVEARLRELADLLIVDRRARKKFVARRQKEKRQVMWTLANYFALVFSMLAILIEIHSRAPKWLTWVETQLESVQKCATDQDALFECVSKGDFSGLVASLILWVSRSAATKRFFLFGFESPKRLWTVVYESLVTALCWGTSYMFIRRGMNPDTRSNFWRKYWKDAVYGSLAGFNASFMKQVLKNLIPQEALEDALQERQLKILSWFPTFH